MILLLTLTTAASLFVPGLALVHALRPRWTPEYKFIVAPAVTVVLYGLAGVSGWLWPHDFLTISRATVFGLTAAGVAFIWATRGWAALRSIDPVLPAAYFLLVLIASQIVFLPIRLQTDFSGMRQYMYYVRRDVLPVRIQSLYHDLPNDNLISYRFAEFMLHGVDFRKPREWDNPDRPAIAPGQSVTARPPLMALVGAHYINLFGPHEPVDGRYGKLGDLLTEAAYIPFFLAAVCLNALLILPVYSLARHFADVTAARVTMLLLACNAGLIMDTNFIWPKAMAGYFALLLVERVMTARARGWAIGLLATLAFYSHPCAVPIVIGACAYYFLTAPRRWPVVGAGVVAAILTAALLVPWHWWTTRWIGDAGNLISQNIGQGAELGWGHVVGARFINMLRTLAPHAIGTNDVPTPRMVFSTSFFTLPGMLGLVMVPLFAAALYDRRFALATVTIVMLSILATTVALGGSHGGLAPWGPFLFIPVAMAMASCVLVRLPRWLQCAVLVLAVAEQAAVLWFGCVLPHIPPFAALVQRDAIRFVVLAVFPLATAIAMTILTLRRPSPLLESVPTTPHVPV